MRLGTLFVIAATLAGCGSDDASVDDRTGPGGDGQTSSSAPGEGPPSTKCDASATFAVAPVAEARGKDAIPVTVDLVDRGGMRGGHPLTVTLVKDGAAIATLHDAPVEPGKASLQISPSVTHDLALGRYTLRAKVGCPTSATESNATDATTDLFLVRLGVTSIDVAKGEGERIDLMYHAVNGEYSNVHPIGDVVAATLDIPEGEPEIDDASGKRRSFASPWKDLATPPVDTTGVVVERGVTMPVSLRVGTKPDLIFRIAKSAANAKGSPEPTGLETQGLPPLRLVVDGTPGVEGQKITPGETVTIRLATSPVPSIARVDASVAWRFETKNGAGAWVTVPGSLATTTLRLYGVLGNSQGTAAPELPWVAVVDEATLAIAGKATDAKSARAILVKHVNEEMGLVYDRASGASHYTDYPQGWTAATFKLARFLSRSMGKVVNCSDCASILSTYANMIGADVHYAIIGWDFHLNPIRGIGSTVFGSPFNSGGRSFHYHAVVSPDATVSIDDATLAVDGDATPATAPFTTTYVADMPGDEYLMRLSDDGRAGFAHVDKTTKLTF